MITGDLNAKLEKRNLKLVASTGNGKALKEIIDKYDLHVVNFQPDTEGKWTRIQKKDGVICKSIIDYIITDSCTQEKVNNTVIDEEKMYTPYRYKNTRKNKSIIYSDHCSISTNLVPPGSSSEEPGGKRLQ